MGSNCEEGEEKRFRRRPPPTIPLFAVQSPQVETIRVPEATLVSGHFCKAEMCLRQVQPVATGGSLELTDDLTIGHFAEPFQGKPIDIL